MLDDFAKRLKEIRTSMNLTMSEFSDLGDVGATTQGAYEKENEDERRYPDVRYLLNLKSHGVDIHYLLTGEKSPENIISTKAMEIINAYENADDNHRAIFEAAAKACTVKPKGRVDKKKDDNEPPKGGIKTKMKNVIAGGNVQAGNITNNNNNFSSTDDPNHLQKNKIKYIGSIFVFCAVLFSAGISLSPDFFMGRNASELTFAFTVIMTIGTLLYKLCIFPVHYEIEMWFQKNSKNSNPPLIK